MDGVHCRQHPWFTLHLPRYLAVMQADTIASHAMIDEEIVHEVVKLGFRRSEVIDSIKNRAQNKVRSALLQKDHGRLLSGTVETSMDVLYWLTDGCRSLLPGHGGILPDVRQQEADAQQRIPPRRAHRGAQPPPHISLWWALHPPALTA
jgi:hypothetical protein